jgi:SAM-dependent methyltransferase
MDCLAVSIALSRPSEGILAFLKEKASVSGDDVSGAPALFDLKAQILRRRRTVQLGPALFLLERATEDLADRLSAVLRPFPVAVDIGTPVDFFARLLRNDPERSVFRVAPPGSADHAALQASPELPPLRDQSADLIVSGYALHAVNDLPGALAQYRRALRPDGLFLACLAGGGTLTELRDCLQSAEADATGGISPRIHPFADLRDMGALLQRAGFALPVTDIDTVTVRYDDLFALLADLRAMGETNILKERLRHPTRRSLFLRTAELYAKRHADADGRIRATFETIWISGWAAHSSQQQPLRPGSAKARLADALAATETPLRG